MNFILMSFLAGLFTWLITALGALLVFIVKKSNEKFISFSIGLGGGIMLASSFFSLILPAISYAEESKKTVWLICGIGFILGFILIAIFDNILSVLENRRNNKKNSKTNILLILAITFHNIPEGMAIGVAFATAFLETGSAGLNAAIILTVGIGIQNFPEGMAISLPLASNGTSKIKAFLIGALSAIVEPIGAVLGAVLVYLIKDILPVVLLLAASAMIYVVVEELIPIGKNQNSSKISTIGFMIGFSIMMILDLAFN